MKKKTLMLIDKLCAQAFLLGGWAAYAFFNNFKKNGTIKDILITIAIFASGLALSQSIYYILKRKEAKLQNSNAKYANYFKPEMISLITTFVVLTSAFALFFWISGNISDSKTVLFFGIESTLLTEAVNFLPMLRKADLQADMKADNKSNNS